MLSQIQVMYIMIRTLVYLTYLREELSRKFCFQYVKKKDLLFACHLLIAVIYILK